MRSTGVANGLIGGLLLAGCAGAQQALRPAPEAPQEGTVERKELRMADEAKVRFCPVWGEPYPEDKAFCLIHGAPLRPEAPSGVRVTTAVARADE